MSRLTTLLLLLPAAAVAQLHSPSQAQTDADYWSRLPGGGSRPFITALTVTRSGTTNTIWSGATSAANSPPSGWEGTAGRISAVVTPTNMCAAGVTPAVGVCYASPNRVSVSLGVTSANNGGLDMDFGTVSSVPTVDASSVFTLTINLGAYANDYAWSWVNGQLTSWNVSNGIVQLSVSPVATPDIDWSAAGNNCCSCDVPSNCNVARARGFTLGTSLFFPTAPASGAANPLAGAVFATQNAVMGSLTLNTAVGSLDYAMASAHLGSTGNMLLGQLNGYLPASAITAVFPSVPLASVPTLLSVARTGDPGSEASTSVAAVNASTFGSDGFMVTVSGVTFSAPTYRVTAVGASAAPRAAAAAAALAAALVALLL